MQLYKSRSFSDFFQDTFGFLKVHGKHYFKHFFIINGVFLLILLAMGYFFTTFYSDILFGGLSSGQSTSELDSFINENLGLFIILCLAFCVVGVTAGIVSYAYTPIYLKLYAENNGTNFSTKNIINIYKSSIGKLFIYIICSIILAIPLLIVFMIGAVALTITIIGILALPLLVGAFVLFYTMALMEYLENKKGIWECYSYSWTLLTSKFWAAVGCVGIFYLMSYILQYIIQIISSIFSMGSLFLDAETSTVSPNEVGSTITIFMIIVFFLSFALSTILGIIIQLNQGIIFYSLKEDNENINTKDIIDQIGSGE